MPNDKIQQVGSLFKDAFAAATTGANSRDEEHALRVAIGIAELVCVGILRIADAAERMADSIETHTVTRPAHDPLDGV